MGNVEHVSVAMAVYNGEKYIREQIESILPQLTNKDELIISYNKSTDNTLSIIKEYERQNANVKLVYGKKTGVIQNFNNSLKYIKGDLVVLSDQDDIWEPNKIATLKHLFENSTISLVVHNCSYINKEGLPIEGDLFTYRSARCGFLKNLMKNSYQGCCMAFRRELLDSIYPIPEVVSMHDQWIGLYADRLRLSKFCDLKLIKYRRRDDNTSGKRVPLPKKTYKMLQMLILIELRILKNRNNKTRKRKTNGYND